MDKLIEQHCADLLPDSAYQVRLALRFFQEFLLLKKYKVKNLQEYQVSEFVQSLRQKQGIKDESGRTHYSNATIRKILYSSMAVSKLAGVDPEIWKKSIKRTPLSSKPEKRPRRRLKKAEIRAILKVLPDYRIGFMMGAFLGLSFGGAIRRGSILALRLGDIKLVEDRLEIFLFKTKIKTNQNAVIAKEFVPHIVKIVQFRSLEGAADNDYIFVNGKGTKYNPRTINKYLTNYSTEALGFSVGTHTGRYSLVTEMYEHGYSHKDIQHVTGHTSLRMIDSYILTEFETATNPMNNFKWKDK